MNRAIAICFMLVGHVAAADKIYHASVSVTPSNVRSVYDGDTFSIDIPSWPDVAGKGISVRVYGIDTPERNDQRPAVKALAASAREHTVSRLRSAKSIELLDVRRDKYFRLLAVVVIVPPVPMV